MNLDRVARSPTRGYETIARASIGTSYGAGAALKLYKDTFIIFTTYLTMLFTNNYLINNVEYIEILRLIFVCQMHFIFWPISTIIKRWWYNGRTVVFRIEPLTRFVNQDIDENLKPPHPVACLFCLPPKKILLIRNYKAGVTRASTLSIFANSKLIEL